MTIPVPRRLWTPSRCSSRALWAHWYIISDGVKLSGFRYGCAHFGIEPFEPDTSNAVLAAILVSDLHNDAAAANPKNKLATVMDLFSENACHGGTFRVAYKTNSYTEVSAVRSPRARTARECVRDTRARSARVSV